MTRDTRSNSIIPRLPFSDDSRAVQWLISLLHYQALILNCYTRALWKKWNVFCEAANAFQNMTIREASHSKKRILVISISSYTNGWPVIQGSGTDWKIWGMLGMSWNFDVVADTLPNADPNRYPTRENIRRYIQALLKENKEGDQFVIVYSGHGDTQGLVLADGSHISPQELRTWLVQPLKSGSTLWTFFDCCESSNFLGLPHIISYDDNQGIRYQPSYARSGRQDGWGTVISIGSAAGPSGEMNLNDPAVPTPGLLVHCGPLAWTAYRFFCSELKDGEPPLLAKFWPSLKAVLTPRPGQEAQFTTSSILSKPLVLPMLRPLPLTSLFA
ncbi:hypothetical protein M407DRAFT_27130 [Tulasnella calospora MUT 4182]|uniref:Peptidase C14 caspase domain-containing protein n=1 Tax=Tulasnella calospora MUT 4182 TaxID=1051891 RepID=A0A0C3QEJ4_9AGAM|nr:hypothetical protein M407DRAFT_27130 [Tulasnella calospora MUT 4182]